MFVKNDQKNIQKLLQAYPNLSQEEQELMTLSIENMEKPQVNERQEMTKLIRSFQRRSLRGELSDSGQIVLTKLNRREWISGLINGLAWTIHP